MDREKMKRIRLGSCHMSHVTFRVCDNVSRSVDPLPSW